MAQNFLDELFQINHVLPENPDDRNCVVCLREIGIMNRDTGFTEHRLRLPCAHIVGSGCLITWLKDNNTCPLCRRELFPPQPPPNIDNRPREVQEDQGQDDQGQEDADVANEEEEEGEGEEQFLLNEEHLEIVEGISDALDLHLPLIYPYNSGQWVNLFAESLEREFKSHARVLTYSKESLGTVCAYIACMFIGCNTSRQNVVAAAPGILATMDADDKGLIDILLEEEEMIHQVITDYLLDESRYYENPGYR